MLIVLVGPSVLHSQDLSFLDDSVEYLWPTEASDYISSTFGETRAAHFHAGLDIRTWGREGYKVFATRDGVLYRLSISPFGYGKMIMLKHEDGSYSLYAHLNRFESGIMAIADSIRMKNYSFLLDQKVKELRFEVQRGDVIGYTGSTGAGPPHLHFELRTPANEPFNPLLTNLRVEDTIPPVFTGLAIEHLDPESHRVRSTETVRPTSSSGTTDFGIIESDGPVGLSVNVHDRANRTPNIYAVYRLGLVQDQDTLFTSHVDTYSYNDATQMFIDRVYPLLRERRQGFQRLFLTNGNHLPFYEAGPTRGVADLPEGEHQMTIFAEDFYGNRSEATLTLRVRDRQSKPARTIHSIPAYSSNVELNGRPAGRIAQGQVPAFTFNNHNSESGLRLNRTGGPSPSTPELHPQIFVSREESLKRVAKRIVPGKRQFLHLPDQSIWIEFPEDALFDTLDVELQVSYRDSLPVVRFSPNLAPLRNPIRVNILLNPTQFSDQPIGIFGYDSGQSGERFLGKAYPGEVIRTRIRRFQEIRLVRDESPPRLGSPRIQRALGGMPVVTVPARDEHSGIDYTQSSIEVNGQRGITEYDPDRNRIIFYKPGFTPDDRNRVDVRLVDRMGNVTERSFSNVTGL